MKLLLSSVVAVVVAQQPALRFEPLQPELFAAGGAFVNAWADYDDDFMPDVFVGFNGTTPNRLYRNSPRPQSRGTFTDVAPLVGLAESRAVRAAAWGDFNGDGLPDLLVGYTPGQASLLKLYENRRGGMIATAGPNGPFVDVTDTVGLTVMTGAVRQPVWIDFDGDGDLDLFVAFRDRPNAMFRYAAGRFADVAAEVGLADPRKSVGAVWFDYDQDGDLDLYVANMDGDANGLFRNDNGHFVDVAEAAGVKWGGRTPNDAASGTVRPCVADVNNDGWFDLFMANYGKNGLFLSKKNGTFEDASHAWGVDGLGGARQEGHYDSCIFGDANNDGLVDVYVNGTITGGVQYPDYLLINTGTRFEDRTPANIRALNADHGAAWADANRDGVLDLALTGSQADGMHSILLNRTALETARSVPVLVRGPRAASQAGGEVRIFKRGTRELVAIGIVDSGSGYDMQNILPVHLGIGARSPADVSIEVTWPAAGKRRVVMAKPVTGGRGNYFAGFPTHVTTPRNGIEALFELASAPYEKLTNEMRDGLAQETAAAFDRYLTRIRVFKSRLPSPGSGGEKDETDQARIRVEKNLYGLFGDATAAAAIAKALVIPYEWEGSAGPPLAQAMSADRYLTAHPKSAAAAYLNLSSARLKLCALRQTDDVPPATRIAEIRGEIDRQLDAAATSGHPILSPLAVYMQEARVCGLQPK